MNKFDVVTYSPNEITLTFGGYSLTGWDTIRIARDTNPYQIVKGIRGKNTRVRNRDTSAVISFSCLQTSDSNNILSEVLAIDEVYGSARLDITLKDPNGQSVFHSSEAFISGYPEVVFSNNLEYRVWAISCLSTDTYNVGGNVDSRNILDKASAIVDRFI